MAFEEVQSMAADIAMQRDPVAHGLSQFSVEKFNFSFHLFVTGGEPWAFVAVSMGEESIAKIPLHLAHGYGSLIIGLYWSDVDAELVRTVGISNYTLLVRSSVVKDLNCFLKDEVFPHLRSRRRVVGIYCYSVKSVGVAVVP